MIKFAWPYFGLLVFLPIIFRFLANKPTQFNYALRLPVHLDTIEVGSSNNKILNIYGEPIFIPQVGRDIMLAVDISQSMEATDLSDDPNTTRLDVVKKIAGEFINTRIHDRMGLVLFGSQAFLHTPLTFDHKTVQKLLQDSLIGFAGNFTAIGDAIAMAVKYLKTSKSLLILLSDGSNTSGTILPLEAAKLAKDFGIKIYTIGIGPDSNVHNYNIYNADLDVATLTKIAELTDGKYFQASDPESLQRIYEEINLLEPEPKDIPEVIPETDLFYIPLGIAFVLTILFIILWISHKFTL